MSGFHDLFHALAAKARAAREAPARRSLGRIKAKYHAFRLLLADNELALAQLSDAERALTGRDGPALAEAGRKLLDTTFDLVDGLNRIADGGESGLYDLYEDISKRLRRALGALDREAEAAPLCLALDEIAPATREFCGGKAAGLGPLRRAGLPVPDGFVATTRACRRFFAANELEAEVRRCLGDVELGKSVEAATEEIGRRIREASVPADVAQALVAGWERLGRVPVSVRSSALVEDRAEHSFAGQFHSELNVTTEEGLLDAFRAVLVGNFGPRPTGYRLQAGLPLADFGMAALVQRMVPARCAGVAFSVDPGDPLGGRMLVTAALGLGTAAVGGDAPVDMFRPLRGAGSDSGTTVPGATPPAGEKVAAHIADKTYRDVSAAGGGVRRAETPGDERLAPALAPDELARLTRLVLMIESLAGRPQDIEWAMTPEGRLRILQARPLLSAGGARAAKELGSGPILLEGGVAAAPGRAVGRAHPARSVREADPAGAPAGLRILVLRYSLVEAAPFLSEYDGVAVELGNPADHLSNLARELGIPMVTGLSGAVERLADGRWIVLDADRGQVQEAPEAAWSGRCEECTQARRRRISANFGGPLSPELEAVRTLLLPLNLTGAKGPTFRVEECASVHDLVRYVHERGVLAMFAAAESFMERAGRLVRNLSDCPLLFRIIDVGGGLAAERPEGAVTRAEIRSLPLAALCGGMAAPGLRWECAAPVSDLPGVMSRVVGEGGGNRPMDCSAYALVARDYLNLNARVGGRFVMIDAVCARFGHENYVRLRIKDSGSPAERHERRVRAISEILKNEGFFTDRRGELLTAVLGQPTRRECEAGLASLGRLLGCSDLLDAAMADESMPPRVAAAFLKGAFTPEELGEPSRSG